jgi:alkylhydroperoxidase family enzyme
MTSTRLSPRIQPLEPPYEEAIAASLAKWMPPGAAVDPLKLFRTLFRHPQLSERMRPLGAALLAHGSVAPQEREIVIDRVCARCGCEYEWGVHVAAFGQAVGLAESQLQATATASAEAALWSEREKLLIQLVDELHETATVSDGLWEKLRVHWSDSQLIELLVLVGWYHLISFVANAARVVREDWAERFPAAQ